MSTTASRESANSRQNMAAGATAGVICRLLTSPLDVLKIRFQLQLEPIGRTRRARPLSAAASTAAVAAEAPKPGTGVAKYSSIRQAVATIVKEEGVRGLWKGNMWAEVMYLSYGAIQFAAFGWFSRTFINPSRPVAARVRPDEAGGAGDQQGGELGGDGVGGGLGGAASPRVSHHQLRSFAGGAFAGLAATMVTYPFDVLRTRFAAQGDPKTYNSTLDGLTKLVRYEGVGALYHGFLPSTVMIAPYMGMQFFLYDSLTTLSRRYLHVGGNGVIGENHGSGIGGGGGGGGGGDDREGGERCIKVKLSTGAELICGAVSGTLSKLLVMPLDVCKKRLQVQGFESARRSFGRVEHYAGLADCFRKIYRQEGVAGLFKGSVPGMLKAGPAAAVTFVTFEHALRYLVNNDMLASRLS